MRRRLPLLAIVTSLLVLALHGQSDAQLSDYFDRFPDADANGDGQLTRQEASAHRQNARRDPSPRQP